MRLPPPIARVRRRGLFVLNIVSSPGAGKTTLLERTLERLKGHWRVGVIEGDVQTDLDARRVAEYGVPVVQIVTNGGCHLEADLVQRALDRLDLHGARPARHRERRQSRLPGQLRSRRSDEGRGAQHD